jgi:TatD DNase family protein
MATLSVMALHPQVVMIGEAGMDKRNGAVLLNSQMEVFREHVRLSELVRKPLIVHCVKAVDELLAIRREMKAAMPWVLHGFRGGVEQWRQLSRAGIRVSIGEHYNEAFIREMPLTELLVESDEQLSVDDIYKRIASDINIDVHELQNQVRNNISQLLHVSF